MCYGAFFNLSFWTFSVRIGFSGRKLYARSVVIFDSYLCFLEFNTKQFKVRRYNLQCVNKIQIFQICLISVSVWQVLWYYSSWKNIESFLFRYSSHWSSKLTKDYVMSWGRGGVVYRKGGWWGLQEWLCLVLWFMCRPEGLAGHKLIETYATYSWSDNF